MKNIFILLVFFLTVILISAKPDTPKETAIVNRMEGFYIFTDCKPSMEYEVLTTLHSKRVNMDPKSFQAYTLSYEQLKSEIFRLMKQKDNKAKCSDAEALIVYPDEQKADIIKFK